MAISKHMLRKMHGVPEPTGEADPAVLARLKYHVAAARWCEKYLSYFDSFFAYIGFFIVLLPIFLKSWRSFIQHTPILSTIFHDYSTQSGWAIINLFVLIFICYAHGLDIGGIVRGSNSRVEIDGDWFSGPGRARKKQQNY
jgi:hypothetical protein